VSLLHWSGKGKPWLGKKLIILSKKKKKKALHGMATERRVGTWLRRGRRRDRERVRESKKQLIAEKKGLNFDPWIKREVTWHYLGE